MLLKEGKNKEKYNEKIDENDYGNEKNNGKYNKLGKNDNAKLKEGIKLKNAKEQIGIEIVSRMRKMADEFSKKYNLNFVLSVMEK